MKLIIYYCYDTEINSLILNERVKPDRWVNSELNVKKLEANKYEMDLTVLDCHSNLPFLEIAYASVSVFSVNSVDRLNVKFAQQLVFLVN